MAFSGFHTPPSKREPKGPKGPRRARRRANFCLFLPGAEINVLGAALKHIYARAMYRALHLNIFRLTSSVRVVVSPTHWEQHNGNPTTTTLKPKMLRLFGNDRLFTRTLEAQQM